MKKILGFQLFVFMFLILTACNRERLLENKSDFSVEQSEEMTFDTEWNDNKPGMYGLNKFFVSWEEIEKRGYMKVKDGKLYTELSEEDGNIYTIDSLKGIIIIPDSVISIGEEVFAECRLINVIIPESVQEICPHAFARTTIKNLKVPSSVTEIGNGAFLNVENVEYQGQAIYEKEDRYWGARAINDKR